MVYICVICMVKRPPLLLLTGEDRQILEAVVSPSVNMEPLRCCTLLVCVDCRRLIQTVLIFQQTALIGVKHLMSLPSPYTSLQMKDSSKDPLLNVKKELENDSLLKETSYIQVELEKIPSSLEDLNIKLEPTLKTEEPDPDSRDNCGLDIETSIPLNTVRKASVQVEPSVQTPGVIHMPIKALTSRKNQVTNTATFTHNRVRVAGGSTVAERAAVKNTQTDIPTEEAVTLRKKQITNTATFTHNRVRVAGGSTVAERAAVKNKQSDIPDEEQSIKPPWHLRVLSEAEVSACRAAAAAAPEFVAAPFKCTSCVVIFKCQKGMDIHARTHHWSYNPFECGVCAQRAYTEQELRTHYAQHYECYCCNICDFRTGDVDAIRRHFCEIKRSEKKKRQRIRYPLPFKCKECYLGYREEAALLRHQSRMHSAPEGPHICDICGKKMKNKVLLNGHILRHKMKENRTLDSFRPDLYCVECNLQVETPSQFKSHMMSLKHSTKENWSYECDECKKTFPCKARVRNHIEQVHLKKKHKCGACGALFATKSGLRRHAARRHVPAAERARTHVCHLCGKRFTVKKSLVEHLLKHEGLRPHKCPLCPATFTYSAALYTHNQLKHLKVKRKWKKKPRKQQKTGKTAEIHVKKSDEGQLHTDTRTQSASSK